MGKKERGFSVAAGLLVLIFIAGVGGAGWYVWQKNNDKNGISNTTTQSSTDNKQAITFANPKKGAHFETSTPAHATTLAAAPAKIVIDFNFDLAENSTIKINKDGKDYGTGDTTIDNNKLALRRKMDSKAPDGVYTVNYDGCWPDKTCHDGSVQFAIDRTQLKTYEDKRGQKSVTIKLSQIKFQPMNIRINAGTAVTWINDDSEEHYVNTDSHPAHTHQPGLNSKVLAKGSTYSYTFASAGAYPYHCSAHAANMKGNIVVE